MQRSPSLFFEGMAGSRLPVVVAHGEGYAEFADAATLRAAESLVALRFVDNRGAVNFNFGVTIGRADAQNVNSLRA